MIELYQFHPTFGLPSASPFCIKLELYLKMAGVAYENVYLTDPRRAPKGKLPFIDDQGTRVADSGLIIEHLEKRHDINLDKALNKAEKATALAFTRMLEEHYYWVVLHSRWFDEHAWQALKQAYFGGLPPLLRNLVPGLIRKQIRRDILGHGLGRHTTAEIQAMGVQTVGAVADFLAGKTYFMGDSESTVDATVAAFIASTIVPQLDSPVRRAVLDKGNLVAYTRRMMDKYFPEVAVPNA